MRTRRRASTSAPAAGASTGVTGRAAVAGHGNAAATERLRDRTATDVASDTWAGYSDFVGRVGWLELYCPHEDEVIRLQTFLKARGLYRYDIDGGFGPYTRAGVISFQRDHELEPDGRVGPKTAAVLDQASGGTATPPAAPEAPAVAEEPASTDADWASISALVADVGSVSLGSSRAAAVGRIQSALATLGHPSSDPTGVFGSSTHDAVVAFQSAHGRKPDGEVGPRTAGSMDLALARGSGVSTEAPVAPTPTGPVSADAAAARAVVLEVMAWAARSERYDAVYGQGEQGTHLRDWMATHRGDARQYGKRYADASGAAAAAPTQVRSDVQGDNPGNVSAYPAIRDTVGSEAGLGLEHLLEYIDSGAYDALTGAEQSMFLRAVRQIGSFYGGASHQTSISNGFIWDPHGGAAASFGSRALQQDADHVGRWECSSLTGYVRDEGPWLDTTNYIAMAHTVDWMALESDAAALRSEVPVGAALVWRNETRGHVKVVIGHLGNQLLIVEAQGSADFVHAERVRPSELMETSTSSEYQVALP